MTLSANAGIALALGRYRIWVDVLHQGKVQGFSTLSPELLHAMQTHPDFQSPDVICVTHCHEDHHSQGLLTYAMGHFPNAQVYHPDRSVSAGILLEQPDVSYLEGPLRLRFFRLPHAGKTAEDCVHYGLLLSLEDTNILFAGDCEVASSALAQALKDIPIHAAVLTFPWITLPRGRHFLQEILRPEQIVVCHLPFAEDDCFGYRSIVERDVKQYSGPGNIQVLREPLQTVWL